jgi:hypothetical protein
MYIKYYNVGFLLPSSIYILYRVLVLVFCLNSRSHRRMPHSIGNRSIDIEAVKQSVLCLYSL